MNARARAALLSSFVLGMLLGGLILWSQGSAPVDEASPRAPERPSRGSEAELRLDPGVVTRERPVESDGAEADGAALAEEVRAGPLGGQAPGVVGAPGVMAPGDPLAEGTPEGEAELEVLSGRGDVGGLLGFFARDRTLLRYEALRRALGAGAEASRLVGLLGEERDEAAQELLGEALAAGARPEDAGALMALARDGERPVGSRLAAALALAEGAGRWDAGVAGSARGAAVEVLSEMSWRTQERSGSALAALGACGPAGLDALAHASADRRLSEDLQLFAAQLLASEDSRRGESALSQLARGARDPLVRAEAQAAAAALRGDSR